MESETQAKGGFVTHLDLQLARQEDREKWQKELKDVNKSIQDLNTNFAGIVPTLRSIEVNTRETKESIKSVKHTQDDHETRIKEVESDIDGRKERANHLWKMAGIVLASLFASGGTITVLLNFWVSK